MAESYPNGLKTLLEKEKLLIMNNFSFSHSVFKRLVSQGRQKVSLCGNGLTNTCIYLKYTVVFNISTEENFEKYCWKLIFCLLQVIAFSQMF